MTGYIVGGSLCIVSFTLYTGKTSSLVLSLFEAPTWTRYLKFPSTAWQGQTCYQERARATSLNHEDPINPDFEATSEMYHRWRLAEELSIRKIANKLKRINQVPPWVYEENLSVQAGWGKKGLEFSHIEICISLHCAGKGIPKKQWVLYVFLECWTWLTVKTSAKPLVLNCIDNPFGR